MALERHCYAAYIELCQINFSCAGRAHTKLYETLRYIYKDITDFIICNAVSELWIYERVCTTWLIYFCTQYIVYIQVMYIRVKLYNARRIWIIHSHRIKKTVVKKTGVKETAGVKNTNRIASHVHQFAYILLVSRCNWAVLAWKSTWRLNRKQKGIYPFCGLFTFDNFFGSKIWKEPQMLLTKLFETHEF